MEVKFLVLKIEDKRNYGSSLEVGKTYTGIVDKKRTNIVWWTDPRNGQEWVFYDKDTCEIVENKIVVAGDKKIQGTKPKSTTICKQRK